MTSSRWPAGGWRGFNLLRRIQNSDLTIPIAFLHGPKPWTASKGNSLEHAGREHFYLCAMYRTDGQCFHSSVRLEDEKIKCQQPDSTQHAWKVVSPQQTLLHNNDSISLHKGGALGARAMKGLAHTFVLRSCRPGCSGCGEVRNDV